MRCPWCEFDGTPRPLHAHLVERHVERVEVHERTQRHFYRILCPVCGDAYEHEIKPRFQKTAVRDPAFVEEHREQIALVGFDMLINHLMAEHELV